MRHVRLAYANDGPSAAGDGGEASVAAFRRGFRGPFLAGYASVQVIVQLRPGGAGGRNPDTGLGVVVSGQLLRVAPGVLAAAGRGLIGPVIWTSREAV